MRRLFWVAVGVGATVVALRRVERATGVVRTLAPANVADSLGRLAESLTRAGSEFRAAMAEQEQRLTEALLTPERDTGGRRARRGPATPASDAPDDWGLDSDDPDLYL